MTMLLDCVMIYVTVECRNEALMMARTLVEERLAACANVLGEVESVYWWGGAVEQGQEVALLLKTKKPLQADLIARVKELHRYECPCIVSLPITAGHPEFLSWIQSETHGASD